MLSEVKILLGIEAEDNSQNDKLQLLLDTARARLKTLLGGIEPPESLAYIVREVAVIRYNRIGSEGVSSHSVEGESMSFSGGEFGQFAEEIQAFLDSQNESKKGRVMFL